MIRNRGLGPGRRRPSLSGMIGTSTRGMLDFGVQDKSDDGEENDRVVPSRQHSGSVDESSSVHGNGSTESQPKKKLQSVLREVVRRRSKHSLRKAGKTPADTEAQGSSCLSDVTTSSTEGMHRKENIQIKSSKLLRKESLRCRNGPPESNEPARRGIARSCTMPIPDFHSDSAPQTTKWKKKVIRVRVPRSDDPFKATGQRSKSPFRVSRDGTRQRRFSASAGRDWDQQDTTPTGQTNAAAPRRRSMKTTCTAGTKNGTAYTGGTRTGRDRLALEGEEHEILIDLQAQESVSSLGLISLSDSPTRVVTRTATTALSNLVDATAISNPSLNDAEVSRPRGLSRSQTLPVAAVIERKDSWKRQMITLGPGVSLPLRGSDETMEAMSRNELVHVDCSACETFLHCISSAEFVLCSVCRSISKVSSGSDDSQSKSQQSIGLGLTVEDLFTQNK